MDQIISMFLPCFGLTPTGKAEAETQGSPYQRSPKRSSSRQDHPNVSISEKFKSPQYFMGLPPSPKIKAAETMGTSMESPATAGIAKWPEDLSGTSVAIVIGNRQRRVSFAPELPRRSTIEPKDTYTVRERSASGPAKVPITSFKSESRSPMQFAMPKREVLPPDRPALKLSIPEIELADDARAFELSESASSSAMADSSTCTPIYTPAHADKLPMPGVHHLQKLCSRTDLASELPPTFGGSTRPELVIEKASAQSETPHASARVKGKTTDVKSNNCKSLVFEGDSSAKTMDSNEGDWVDIKL